MLRQLLRLGNIAVRQEKLVNYKYGFYRNQFLISRQFSSEMIANWPVAIKDFLQKEQITSPTLIQEKTLSIAMNNKDLVGVARTGSGKTLAFAIPAVMKILKENENVEVRSRYLKRVPTCLVLAPTRELASQTASVFQKFEHLGIQSLVLVGGASRSEQTRGLARENSDVYIATPGRLLDLIESELVDLSSVKYLVLDEADRMLDMGFEPQIRRIIKTIPDKRQTLMWSATWPREIQDLANEFLKDYEYIAVDSEKLKANPNITQIFHVIEPRNKFGKLIDTIEQARSEHSKPRILIFANTKRTTENLLLQLMRNRLRAVTMHGDRSQKQRDDALRMFKDQVCNILIATDVAARGLDINDITHVINYDVPNTVEDYIHRIGRTARHEKKGTSITLFTENDAQLASKMIKVLKETNQKIPVELEEFTKIHSYDPVGRNFSRRKRRFDDFYSRGSRNNQPTAGRRSLSYDDDDDDYGYQTNRRSFNDN